MKFLAIFSPSDIAFPCYILKITCLKFHITGTTPSRFERKNSMDLSNGTLDLTRRINETLARHGLNEKRTQPGYEPPTPVRFNRGRESKDREIVNPLSPTGSWRRSSTNSDLRNSVNSVNSDYGRSNSTVTDYKNNSGSTDYKNNSVST